MYISNSSITYPNFKKETAGPATTTQKPERTETFLDKFETGIRNSADLNDTVQVPRTIFKGYLAFMAGTTMQVFGALTKNKFPKSSIGLNILSVALMLWGTFNFVKPYILKGKQQ